MEPIKLGVIGCGIAATELHWPALKKLPEKFQIAMVCNNTEEKAKAFASLVGDVPHVLDYHDLLENDEIEAVDIALPIYMNLEVVTEALAAGKHVFVEKPLAANMDQARELLQLSEKYPQVTMVGENWRYHRVFIRLKELMAEDCIGEPYALFWDVLQLVTLDSKYAQTHWRLEHKHEGGFITDGGIHNIAALRFMFDEIVAGNAFSKLINPEIGEVDTLSLQFATKNNVHGVLNIFRSPQGVSKNELLILGTMGSLLVEANKKIIIKQSDGSERVEPFDADTSYQAEFEDFFKAIKFNTQVTSTFHEAYHDLRILLSVLQNSRRFQQNKL